MCGRHLFLLVIRLKSRALISPEKKNEIEIIATIYLNSFKKSRQPNAITQGPLKKWTEHFQEWHLLKIPTRGAPITPGVGWGL